MIAECLLLLIYPAIADIRNRKFYIEPVVIISVIAAFIRFICQPDSVVDILMGCLPGIAAMIFCVITREAIGAGDAAVITGLGIIMGWRDACLVCLIGLALCGVTGIVLIALKKADKKTVLPFVPFLMAAVLIIWCIRR